MLLSSSIVTSRKSVISISSLSSVDLLSKACLSYSSFFSLYTSSTIISSSKNLLESFCGSLGGLVDFLATLLMFDECLSKISDTCSTTLVFIEVSGTSFLPSLFSLLAISDTSFSSDEISFSSIVISEASSSSIVISEALVVSEVPFSSI